MSATPPHDSDLMATLERDRRRESRRLWWFVCGSLLVLLVVFLIAFFRDDPLPDDAWILPEELAYDASDNVFQKALEKIHSLPHAKLSDLSKETAEGRLGKESEIRAFVEKHAELVEVFRELMKSDPATWRVTAFTEAKQEMYLSNVLGVTYVLRPQALQMTREGKAREARTLAVDVIRFGKGLHGSDGVLVHCMVAFTVSRIGYQMLESAMTSAPMTESELKELQARLAPLEFSATDQREVLKNEYQFSQIISLQRGIVDDPAMSEFSGPTVPLRRWRFRPHRNLARTLAYYGPKVKALEGENPGPEMLRLKAKDLEMKAEWEQRFIRRILSPNAAGDVLFFHTLEMLGTIHTDLFLGSLAEQRMAMIQLALRRYELAMGHLPENLTELVPAYLSAVPLDPFDNQPMRWDRQGQKIYALNADQKDDGGSFTKFHREEKDLGQFYAWGSIATEEREKKYAPMAPAKAAK